MAQTHLASLASSYRGGFASVPAREGYGGGAIASATRPVPSNRPFSTVGAGVSVSTLGIGAQIATPLAKRVNLRVQGHYFPYSLQYTDDGITFNGNLKLRDAIASVDWYPFKGSFHLSPGVKFYGGFHATGGAVVPAGQSFTLNDTDYTSSAANPIHGTGSVTTGNRAPVFTLGWGNLVSRKEHKGFSVPFEVGFAYQGAPKVNFGLAGVACDSQNNCGDVSTDPTMQANVAAAQKTANDDLGKYFRFYPVISIGFGYKF